jgi:hypothetical protein
MEVRIVIQNQKNGTRKVREVSRGRFLSLTLEDQHPSLGAWAWCLVGV